MELTKLTQEEQWCVEEALADYVERHKWARREYSLIRTLATQKIRTANRLLNRLRPWPSVKQEVKK